MKTIKEMHDSLPDVPYDVSFYLDWYKEAIEWIFNEITDWNFNSTEEIQKYLQDLLIK